MADFSIKLEKVRLDSAGIMEVCKSSGMRSALNALAQDMRSQADAMGHLHRTEKRPHYAAGVDVLDRTAVGWVGTGDKLSRIDEKYHKTLESLNH